MAKISKARIEQFIERSDGATSPSEKGRALEDLICYLLGKVPGISISARNELNNFQSEEIDMAFWNDRPDKGFHFLPEIILVECKNWNDPIGSREIAWFDNKLRLRGQIFGILFAANGITGDAQELTNGHQTIARALQDGRRLIVITLEEIRDLDNSSKFVELIKEKLTILVVTGTTVP